MDNGPIIHRHSDSFDERNMVLHLSLGLASVNRTLRAGLAPAADPQPTTAHDEALIDLLVGLIHATDIVANALDEAKTPVPERQDSGALDGVSLHTERTLLR